MTPRPPWDKAGVKGQADKTVAVRDVRLRAFALHLIPEPCLMSVPTPAAASPLEPNPLGPTGAPQSPRTPPAPVLAEPEARRIDLYWAAVIVGAMAAVFLVLNLARGVAAPVLVSLAIAYVVDPIADLLERRGVNRTLAVAIIFVGTALAIAGLLMYLVPAIGTDVARLPAFFRAISDRALPEIERLLGAPLPGTLREAANTLSTGGSNWAAKLLPGAARVALAALGGTASLLTAAIGIVVVPVVTFFFLRDYDRIVGFFRDLIPGRYRAHMAGRIGEIDRVLGSFVRGQLTVGAILATIYSTGLSIARIDLAVVIGLIAGFGNLVPYVGTATGVVLALLATLVSWQGPWQLVAVAVTFGCGQVLDALVLTPRIVGSRVGLTPVVVIIAILAFGEIFGFVGVMLAVPTTAALKVVATVLIARYRSSPLYAGEASR